MATALSKLKLLQYLISYQTWTHRGPHDASHDTCIVFGGQQCRVREIKEERKSHQGH
jgi:hypothetical protein